MPFLGYARLSVLVRFCHWMVDDCQLVTDARAGLLRKAVFRFRRSLQTSLFGQSDHGALWTLLTAPCRNIHTYLVLHYLWNATSPNILHRCPFIHIQFAFSCTKFMDMEILRKAQEKLAKFRKKSGFRYTGGPKSKPLPHYEKNVSNRIEVCQWDKISSSY